MEGRDQLVGGAQSHAPAGRGDDGRHRGNLLGPVRAQVDHRRLHVCVAGHSETFRRSPPRPCSPPSTREDLQLRVTAAAAVLAGVESTNARTCTM
jgi:hypothetical protein